MYWSWDYNGKTYVSWGEPRRIPKELVTNLQARFDVPIYSGQTISPSDHVAFQMQGDSSLGLGDSIWLISFMRDIYSIKARRRCNFTMMSSGWVLNFYKNFLPSSFNFREEYMEMSEFETVHHKLPAMYYWHDQYDDSDRSWVDNRSLIERLYNWTGMQYDSLPDWGEFTNQEILYPSKSFFSDKGIQNGDKYVFFQWHSSGEAKNLPPKSNVSLIRHIIKKYGYKVVVVGRLKCLDMLESIPGVINLSGKTEGRPEALFSLAFNSEFIVCPDSAGVHMAEAFRIPCVCIMSTLPPVYISSKYKIPAFMLGSGKCGHKPCGIVHALPREKCPPETGDYCNVLNEIDHSLFDRCVEQTFKNRFRYRREDPIDFYGALSQPISLKMV